MSSLPYSTIDGEPRRGRRVAVAVALAVVLTATVATLTHKRTHESSSASQLDTASSAAPPTTSDKVEVYIIAEAFCPNCKEHSYLFDSLVMDEGDDVRDILDVKMDMLVLDGWFAAGDEGICEKGKYDCQTAKYHMAAQRAYKDDAGLKWWDFSRCLFKAQPELIAWYSEEEHVSPDKLEKVVEACASSASLDYGVIAKEMEDEGTHLLKESYGRTIEYDMPVWVYVNGKYIEYEDDWMAAVCAAYAGDAVPAACASKASLSDGSVGLKSKALFPDNNKVDVYIVAEAFCPNCKEHSYYFDSLVMSPESAKSGLRDVMNLKLEQMVIDGWNTKTDTGMCEKGRWDCEFSRFQLCGQETTKDSDSLDWWDYSRCLYEHQAEMIDYYYENNGDSPLLMHRITSTCADDAGLDSTTIKECVDTQGNELLYDSFKRIGEMSNPVWIYVNGQRIGYHEDWLAAICAAAVGQGHTDVEECQYFADVGRKK